jgi:uncharacterized membrane protein (GlpM family)
VKHLILFIAGVVVVFTTLEILGKVLGVDSQSDIDLFKSVCIVALGKIIFYFLKPVRFNKNN